MRDPKIMKKVSELSVRMNNEDGISNGIKSFYKQLPIDNMVCDVSLFLSNQKSELARIFCLDCQLKMSKKIDNIIHRESSNRSHHARIPWKTTIWGNDNNQAKYLSNQMNHVAQIKSNYVSNQLKNGQSALDNSTLAVSCQVYADASASPLTKPNVMNLSASTVSTDVSVDLDRSNKPDSAMLYRMQSYKLQTYSIKNYTSMYDTDTITKEEVIKTADVSRIEVSDKENEFQRLFDVKSPDISVAGSKRPSFNGIVSPADKITSRRSSIVDIFSNFISSPKPEQIGEKTRRNSLLFEKILNPDASIVADAVDMNVLVERSPTTVDNTPRFKHLAAKEDEVERAYAKALKTLLFWQELDVNHDGKVDASELTKIFQTQKQIDVFISRLDRNSDNQLSFTEFAWMIAMTN